MYPNRYVCDVLEEIRACYKTRNFSPIVGLVDEVQIMVNRMEARLYDVQDMESLENRRSELNKEIEQLKKEKKPLDKPDQIK